MTGPCSDCRKHELPDQMRLAALTLQSVGFVKLERKHVGL